jgi:hypothetical protein
VFNGKRVNEIAPLDGTFVGKVDGTGVFVGVDGSVPLRAGQVRVIVLPDHQLSGAARSRRTTRGSRLDFFIRSATGYRT